MDLIYYDSKVKLKKETLESIINNSQDYIIFLGKRENPKISLKYATIVLNLDQQPYLFNGASDKKKDFYESIENSIAIPILYFEEGRDEHKVLLKIASHINPQKIVYITNKSGIYENGKLKSEITKEELRNINKEPNRIDDIPQLLELLKYTDEIILGKTKITGYNRPY